MTDPAELIANPAPPAEVKPVWSPADKARIGLVIERWQRLLFLDIYGITVKFSDEPAPIAACAADVRSNRPYMDSTITVYPTILEHDHDEQDRLLVHELTHIITGAMRHLFYRLLVEDKHIAWTSIIDADEHMTDIVAKIFIALHRG